MTKINNPFPEEFSYIFTADDGIKHVINSIFNSAFSSYSAPNQEEQKPKDSIDISEKPTMTHLYTVYFCIDGRNKHLRLPGVSIKDVIHQFWDMARTMNQLFGDWFMCEVTSCKRSD